MGEPVGSDAALVAGGSSGLGLGCARLLAERGVPTLIAARRATAIDVGPGIVAVATDLMVPDAVARLRDEVEERGLRVRWLVNAVGVGLYKRLGNATAAQIETALRTNLSAPIFVARTFLDHLIASHGTLCNIVSRAALRGIAGETIYCAGKWGLRGFTEALREELRGRVRVVGVYPGPFDSPFWNEWRGTIDRDDWHTFMNTEAVARQVVNALLDTGDIVVTDLVVNRP